MDEFKVAATPTKPSVRQRITSITRAILLWSGAMSLLYFGVTQQTQHPGSLSLIPFAFGALLLAPPSRAQISKVVSVTARRTMLMLALVVFIGGAMAGSEQTAHLDRVAATKGFTSHRDMTRAAAFGLTSQEQLRDHDSKAKADEEAAQLRRAELAETERTAAAEAEKNKQAACRRDLKCWGDGHSISAAFACRPHVERLAKFQFQWTDSLLEPKFSRFRWNNKEKGIVTYIGDKIKFQNGFGAWQFATYTCDYDPDSRNVLHVDATPGRIPE
jgi:hypothetical protein